MKQYKKLFAILTLLCFAMTLMPVAAFAAVTPSDSYVYTDDVNAEIDSSIIAEDDDNSIYDWADICFDLEPGTTTNSMYVWFVKDGSNVATEAVVSKKGIKPENGVFEMEKVSEGEKYSFAFTSTGKYTVHAALVNPLAKYNSGKFATKAEAFRNAEDELLSLSSDQKTITVESNSDSAKYTLQVVDKAGLPWGSLQYKLTGVDEPAEDAITENMIADKIKNNGQATIGAGVYALSSVNNFLTTNGVASEDITFKLLDKDGKAVKGATMKLSTSNTNCIVNKDKVVTDQLGQFKFNIALTEESPHTDGFTIYIECGSYEGQLKIMAASTGAYDLQFTMVPQNAIATDDVTAGSHLSDYLNIRIMDVNGNTVMPATMQPGDPVTMTLGKTQNPEPAFAGVISGYNESFEWTWEEQDYKSSKWGKGAADYVSVVSKPAGSKLENEDVWLTPADEAPFQSTLYFAEDLIAGDYSFKITLANGKYKILNLKIAEMGTPVQLTVTPKTAVVEVGGKTSASFKLVDANGTTCDALKKGTDVAVTGYAVQETILDIENSSVKILVKNDDKYLGNDIKVIATNDRYNLMGEGALKVTEGNAFITTMVKEAKINTPTDLMYMLMDKNGLMMVSGDGYTAGYPATDKQFRVVGGQTSFVVVAKPEGAKVNFDARAAGGAGTSMSQQGYGQARIECDKPGVVTIQMTVGVEIYQADTQIWSPRYYTGTQNIVFSDGSIGKTVVMSIGSSEIVIDGEKAAIDAAPIVQNSRTYVPFRALAEAFGAEVAYDEATQAVTATLGSNTVVMTIGSASYTVNGEEKTADVAPFISGGRTMVPVRFAAEAFGSKVIPTYDDNGATADVLFKL